MTIKFLVQFDIYFCIPKVSSVMIKTWLIQHSAEMNLCTSKCVKKKNGISIIAREIKVLGSPKLNLKAFGNVLYEELFRISKENLILE